MVKSGDEFTPCLLALLPSCNLINNMDAVALESSTYTLQIPAVDKSFFLSLVKKMGWTAKKTKAVPQIPSATLAALQEAKDGKDAGGVDMTSLDSFIKSMD